MKKMTNTITKSSHSSKTAPAKPSLILFWSFFWQKLKDFHLALITHTTLYEFFDVPSRPRELMLCSISHHLLLSNEILRG
jgi:hypothetical protein